MDAGSYCRHLLISRIRHVPLKITFSIPLISRMSQGIYSSDDHERVQEIFRSNDWEAPSLEPSE